jgi:O-antigen/teichoic acid export membrane protein
MPRTVTHNSFFVFAGQAFGALTALAYVPLLTRYLGESGYGTYAYVYAFVGLFQAISQLGLNQILLRESARHRDAAGTYLGHALRLKGVLALSTFALLLLLNQWINEPAIRTFVWICALEVLIRVFFNANLAIGRAFERMEYEMMVLFVDRIVSLIGVLIVVAADLGFTAIFGAFLAGSIAHAVASVLLVWPRLAAPRFQRIAGLNKKLLKEAWPIGLGQQLKVAYQRQGTVFLKQWHPASVVGLYSAAYRMYQLSQMISDSIVSASFPVFSRLFQSSKARLTQSFSKTVRYLLLGSLLLAIGVWAFAPSIVRVLLGPGFQESEIVLRWLAPIIVLAFLNMLFGRFLQATDQQQIETLVTGVAMIVNLGLNLLLIPRYGYLGPVWALCASEAIACLLGGFFSLRQVDPIPWRRSVVAPLGGGVAAAFVLWGLQNLTPFVSAAAALAALVLGFVALAALPIRGLDQLKEDLLN